MAKEQGLVLSDTQAAIADYARREQLRGRSLDSIAEELRRGGMPTVTSTQIEAWLNGAVDEDKQLRGQPDPLCNEPDETRRREKFESLALEAAELVPGAAELLGVNAFAEPAQEKRVEEHELVRGFINFVVAEIETPYAAFTTATIHIPKGGRYEVWDYHGTRTTKGSTTVIFDRSGEPIRIEPMTRPRGKPRLHRRSLQLPVRKCTIKSHCDLDVILQRLIHVVLTFLPQRHAPCSQAALAYLVERTKQAINHQPLLMAKAPASADGRTPASPSPGVRCLRGKRRVA